MVIVGVAVTLLLDIEDEEGVDIEDLVPLEETVTEIVLVTDTLAVDVFV